MDSSIEADELDRSQEAPVIHSKLDAPPRSLEASSTTDPLFEPITTSRLSDQVRHQLLDRIADGSLPPLTHLSEAVLARQLGVSRTPLHEALSLLGRDGLVESLGRRGWRVTPLSETAAREIYPVLGSLEALALELTGPLVLGVVDELRALVNGSSGSGELNALEMGRRWHDTLLAQCPNRLLADVLRPLLVRATRLERARARAGAVPLPSELASVVHCLERTDVAAASRLLDRHWRARGTEVVEFMRRRSETDGGAPVTGAA